MLTHKGDLCFLHWRRDLEALRSEEVAFSRSRLRAYLAPTYSYLSVIELGTYELTGHAVARLEGRGRIWLRRGAPGLEVGAPGWRVMSASHKQDSVNFGPL